MGHMFLVAQVYMVSLAVDLSILWGMKNECVCVVSLRESRHTTFHVMLATLCVTCQPKRNTSCNTAQMCLINRVGMQFVKHIISGVPSSVVSV